MIPTNYIPTMQSDLKVLGYACQRAFRKRDFEFTDRVLAAAGRCFASIVMLFAGVSQLRTFATIGSMSTGSAMFMTAFNLMLYIAGLDIFTIYTNLIKSEVKQEVIGALDKAKAGFHNLTHAKSEQEPIPSTPLLHGTYMGSIYQAAFDLWENKGKK